MSLKKRIITIVVVLALIAGLAAGGAYAWHHRSKKQVNVYEIRDSFAMTDYWGDSSQTDGMVGVEGIQPVYLSDTMTVKEVLVKEGQQVKKGDPLLSYDTTLTELDVQLKDVQVQQAQLDLTNAQKELSTIKSYRAGEYIPGSVTKTEIPGVSAEQPAPFVPDGTLMPMEVDGKLGDGSYAHPFTYLWKNTYSFDDAFLYQAMRGMKECYVRFLVVGSGEVPEHVHEADEQGWISDEQGHHHVCAICGEAFDEQEHQWVSVYDKTTIEDEQAQVYGHKECKICGEERDSEPLEAEDLTQLLKQAREEGAEQARKEAEEKAKQEEAKRENEKKEEPGGSENPGSENPGSENPGSEATGGETTGGTESTGGQGGSNPTTAPIQAELLMQFQSSEAGSAFQLISIRIPSLDENGDAQEAHPLYDFHDSQPLPALPPEEPAEDIPDETIVDGIKYTAEELKEMRQEAESKVRDAELDLRKAKLEYDKAAQELNNGAITATIDGKVKDVLTQDEARDQGSAILNVTAGGGYYIRCTLSELERDTVQLGQQVKINSWNDGSEYQGKITEISDYPSGGSNWGAGNSNVSYYPFTVFVSEDAGLREGDYVGVEYGAAASEKGFYLQSMLVRTENGRSYVYRDHDGVLEKCYISTGKNIWGSYTQVLGGITLDDKLAFPYGTNVVDGAPTVLASQDQFYGY